MVVRGVSTSMPAPGPNTKRATNERKRATDIVVLKTENPTLTTREIGKLVDCDHSHVVRVLQRYGLVAQEVQDYKAHRADIFAGLQRRLIDSITDDDIKKAQLQTRLMGLGILYDKERLERGQSTQNIDVISQAIARRERTTTPEPDSKSPVLDVDFTCPDT